MQQSALPGTGSTDDRQPLADTHFEVDAEQHRYFAIALTVNLAQTLAGENDLTHNAGPPPG